MPDRANASEQMGRRLKLHDLRLFMAVVETGSMGRAARRLNTSQPNVSRAIAELEQTMGVRLLERHRQGVAATQYGRALLDCGVAVFDELGQGLKAIELLSDPAAGEVRLGSPPPIAATFAAAVIDRLSHRYPRMMFDLTVAESETLFRHLRERRLDLLIARRFGAIADERLNFEILYRDSYVVAAGAQSPLARRRRIALADLTEEAWVLPPPGSVIGAAARDAFRAAGVGFPSVRVVTVPPETRASLVATGRFLTIFPTSAVRFLSARPDLKVLPVELRTAPDPVAIVTIKNRRLSPAAQRFAEQARALAKTLPRGHL
jgi:DNA-binding transcriptional LysR family regulator